MRALPVAAAVAAVVLLAGCARPAAEPTEAPTTAPTSQAPVPTSEPSATPTPTETDPHADWRRIETPNGTASFRIPPGWTAEIGGQEMLDYDFNTVWSNSIVVSDGVGQVRLHYWDGSGDHPGPILDFGIVDEQRIWALDEAELEGVAIDIDGRYLEHWVRAWWDGSEPGIAAHVAVTPGSFDDEQPEAGFTDGRRLIFFGIREEFDSEQEATEWLQSAEAAEAFEVLTTLDLHGAAQDAMPGD